MNPQVFIGKPLEVLKALNRSLEGIKGVVVDETKHTFEVDTGDKTVKVLKKNCIFRIDGKHVDGNTITKRSYDRIKK